MPTINEVLNTIAGGALFTKLDLQQAYQQLVVDDDTAELMTINTHKGLFKVNRLAFGISAAPRLFQKVMDGLLKDIPGVVAYLDDIVVSGATKSEHDERLFEVLQRLRRYKLTVRKDKCCIAKPVIEYLGYKVDANGIHPTMDKVKAIHSAPSPKNKDELRSFLGMVNFYNRFLKNKATVAENLHRLLDNDAVFVWNNEHEEAFMAIKQLLQSDMVLTHFDENKQLVLACDASPYGIGVVLSHRESSGDERPIAFASRTLGSNERNYGQFDKEALAIMYGVIWFHQYVAGRHVIIVTDHKPLLGTFQTKKPIPPMLSPRMTRWCLKLAAYDYTMEYRPGKNHYNADFLSRLPLAGTDDETVPPGDILMLEGFTNPPIAANKICNASKTDPVISKVMRFVIHGWPAENPDEMVLKFYNRRLELSTHKGCLLWGSRVVVPEVLRSGVMELLHANHPGSTTMKACARSYVWWPGLDENIEMCVNRCRQCQEVRNEPKSAPRQFLQKPENPWSKLHLDFAGPFKNNVFLIIVDSYSKWLEVKVVKNQSSAEVIRCLRELFASHGVPDTIISDNGAAFVSDEIKGFYELNGIKYYTSAPYHPSSNGQAERMVQVFKNNMRLLEDGDIHLKLARLLFKQHMTPHAETGKTPAELLMGRKLRSALDKLHPDSIVGQAHMQEPILVRGFEEGDSVLFAIMSVDQSGCRQRLFK